MKECTCRSLVCIVTLSYMIDLFVFIFALRTYVICALFVKEIRISLVVYIFTKRLFLKTDKLFKMLPYTPATLKRAMSPNFCISVVTVGTCPQLSRSTVLQGRNCLIWDQTHVFPSGLMPSNH